MNSSYVLIFYLADEYFHVAKLSADSRQSIDCQDYFKLEMSDYVSKYGQIILDLVCCSLIKGSTSSICLYSRFLLNPHPGDVKFCGGNIPKCSILAKWKTSELAQKKNK